MDLRRPIPANQQSDQNFKALAENCPDLIARFDRALRHIYVNPMVTKISGLSYNDYIGKTNRELGMPGELVDFWDKSIRQVFESGKKNKIESAYHTPDGIRHFQTLLVPEFNDLGCVQSVLSCGRDITEQKESEMALKAANQQINKILASINDGFIVINDQMVITYFNQAAERLLGRSSEEVLHTNVFEAFPQAIGSLFSERYRQTTTTNQPLSYETYFDQPPYENWYDIKIYPFTGGIAIYFQVVTERKNTEQALKNALYEKKILLKEVYHRVKNNLQTVTSLINLQMSRATAAQDISLLRDLRNRIAAMVLVHTELYISDSLAEVDCQQYLKKLANNLRRSFSNSNVNIRIEASGAVLNLSNLIPCGLIVTELITNALKYAFPANFTDTPEIQVKLWQEDDQMNLVVSDNGIGLPPEIAQFASSATLGMELVHSWATHQLEGSIEINIQQGTHVEITFPV